MDNEIKKSVVLPTRKKLVLLASHAVNCLKRLR